VLISLWDGLLSLMPGPGKHKEDKEEVVGKGEMTNTSA
jgi:hypothetical protein